MGRDGVAEGGMVNDIRPACRIDRSPPVPQPHPMSQRSLATDRLQRAHRGEGLQPAPVLADEAEACAVLDDVARALHWFGEAMPGLPVPI